MLFINGRQVSREEYAAHLGQWGIELQLASQTQSSQLQPCAYADWSLWAKALSKLSTPEDKGIGDIVARIIGPESSEAFKKWYKTMTGYDCGCNGRQRELNLKYPL